MTTHPPGHPSGPTGPGRVLVRLLGGKKGARPPSRPPKKPTNTKPIGNPPTIGH